MSFREKLAWASLAAHFIVFGLYFSDYSAHWRVRMASDDHGLGQLIGAVILLVVLSIGLTVAAMLSAQQEWKTPLDEREEFIRLRAANLTAAVVTTGVVGVIWTLLAGWNAILAANLLLLILVIGEIVKAGSHIFYFRRGS